MGVVVPLDREGYRFEHGSYRHAAVVILIDGVLCRQGSALAGQSCPVFIRIACRVICQAVALQLVPFVRNEFDSQRLSAGNRFGLRPYRAARYLRVNDDRIAKFAEESKDLRRHAFHNISVFVYAVGILDFAAVCRDPASVDHKA